jgi:Kef-type K+ transport system membrane component KefB
LSLTDGQLGQVVVALVALLCAAHGCGYLFARARQPRVVGEIVGGLLLGPTLFGLVLPHQQAAVFPKHGPTPIVLAAVYQLGLLLLMHSAGAEVRSLLQRGERRTATFITGTGTLLPFAFGLGLLQLIDLGSYRGPAGGQTAFLIVFASAMAVTSIPVISRIMLDLGILSTPFARIVLGAAVMEDIPLYVMLAIALGLAQADQGQLTGLPSILGVAPGGHWAVSYHVVATLTFFAVFLLCGPSLFRLLVGFRLNFVNRISPIGFHLVFMLLVTGLCTFIGVTPLFGAFVAGMAASSASDDPAQARAAIKSFSFAFFVPIYFAIVGIKLDLVRHFDPLFFLSLLALACVAKALSVYAGARLAGESASTSKNLAVAMNARGGPGIVLASVAYDAGIIKEELYTALVLLAIVTSMLAGSWLERVVRSGKPLREPTTFAPGAPRRLPRPLGGRRPQPSADPAAPR